MVLLQVLLITLSYAAAAPAQPQPDAREVEAPAADAGTAAGQPVPQQPASPPATPPAAPPAETPDAEEPGVIEDTINGLLEERGISLPQMGAADESTNPDAANPDDPNAGSSNTPPLQANSAVTDGTFFERVWHFRLFQLRDRTIELSQVVIALVTLFGGLVVSRWVTLFLAARISARSRLKPNAVAVLQRLVFYVMMAAIVVMSMDIAGIPITSLAFIGGALAIGVGFGAQNLINNFISGLILMIEQPIRVGDMIRVDDHLGHVATIGARCTRVRRTDGIDVLVPNSKLLEDNVINWMLKDDRVRTSVGVGVAYGSPTRRVSELILQAVEEHDKLIREPKPPIVSFQEFGDNSLNFEVYFWTRATSEMQLRVMRSDIRHRIDELFKDEGIVIAFPQRDVHLDTLAPLEVRVVRDGDER